jgi:UDP-N-acetylmuramoyl-L-alanyl-D-glutamate--2,6-diaminopimelate ligase
MRLDELAAALPAVVSRTGDDVNIEGIVADSRLAELGVLFVAIPGLAVDGHRYAGEAIARGAVAAIGERERSRIPGLPHAESGFPYLRVPNSREAWGWLCAAWHAFPSRKLTLVGVTGTDGKTTTVNLIESILAAAGVRTGMVSTVSARIGGDDMATGLHVTTPDPPQVQSYLARMVDAGASHAVLETTSEGLAQHRVAGCDFDVAVLTNITHEHVSAHGSFVAYREAKARLFRMLSASARKPRTPKVSVLNRDDSSFVHLAAIPADRRISYGLGSGADVTAVDIQADAKGTEFTLLSPEGRIRVRTPLVGAYNISNILAAACAAIGLGIDLSAIGEGVAAMQGVPGRMEWIDEGQGFQAIVDFAHTPNALEQALRAARELVAPEGRIIVVFGSAGLRDPGKRWMMGRVAGALADLVIITAEDPRTEDVNHIMADCLDGVVEAGGAEGRDVWCIADRGRAVYEACQMASSGDLVIVCGKGHEQSMCFGTVEYPWDDRAALRQALRGRVLSALPTSDPSWGGSTPGQ